MAGGWRPRASAALTQGKAGHRTIGWGRIPYASGRSQHTIVQTRGRGRADPPSSTPYRETFEKLFMGYGRLKRALYAGNRPGRIARVLNRFWAVLHAWGISPNHLVTLEVQGWRSGRTVRFPLVMATHEGERYLVSMLGPDVAWVKNIEAAEGHAILRHGRREQVHLELLPVELRAPVLKVYLQRAPGARPHLPVDRNAPLSAFETVAAAIPVFRVRAGS